MEKWLFCFVCKKEFGAVEPLVQHIIEQGHKLSIDEQEQFLQAQLLVGAALKK